ALHQAIDLVGVQRLVAEQGLGDGDDLVPVLPEHALSVAIGLVHQAADLLVDQPGGLVGVFLLGHEAVARVAAAVADEAEAVAHARRHDHVAGDVGDLLNVHRGAAGDIAGLALFGDAPAAGHAHRRLQPAEAEAVAILLGQA